MLQDRTLELKTRTIPHPSGCLMWTGPKTFQGYGILKAAGQNLAHRVSYRVSKGEIPKGMLIMHSCDNPSCVNPDHLSVGTWAQNNRDRADKGRNNHRHEGATHCKRGHEFNETNTYFRKTGGRMCRACACMYQKNRRLK